MISKKTKKDILILTGIWLFIGFASIIGINAFISNKIEKEIINMNGYEGPKNTWFEGMKISFDSVQCNGFYTYTCELNNFSIKGKFKDKEEKIIETKKAVVYNAEKTSFNKFNTFLNIKLEGIYPVNRFKEIIIPSFKNKEAQNIANRIDKILFPIDLYIKASLKRDKDLNSIGNIVLNINNNMADFSSNAEFITILNKNNYSVKLDSNGTLYHDNNITDKKLAEFKMNQKYFTYLNKINFTFYDKNTFNLLYDMYLINMRENPYRKNYINNTLLGVNESNTLNKKQFSEIFLKRLKTYKSENPNYLGKKSTEFLELSIQGKKPKITLKGIRKNNFTLEDYLVLTSMVEKDKEKLLEKHYDFNVTIGENK